MKIIYSYVDGNPPQYIPTGNGYQRILLWFEDNSDWLVFFCDDNLSKVYIHRVVDKTLHPSQIFSMWNLETIDEASFDTYEKYITANYNYQGLHKGEKIDG